MKSIIVKVYRNLKHGRKAKPLYSVMYKGRVIKRVHRILLSDVTFYVNESGRRRVIRDKRKNVHAFVIGKIAIKGACGIDKNGQDLPVQIKYNPYLGGTFFTAGVPDAFNPVRHAGCVLLNEHGITAAYID